ncbi:SET domain-containing protein [Candidatus Korobacter versatilis]|uniref:SET domain-containing protein n=1 Tax=Candidatus Korobacter versatilis TaxID=658062 RepID=UPI0002F7BCBD|nr:SET domain-containing protein-lysine N-methyltransferase [Candidatus Koribacter versatilis]
MKKNPKRNSHFAIIRSSRIHAAGVFSTQAIKKGTLILEYDGPRLSKEAADIVYENRKDTYLFGIGDGTQVIDGHSMAMFVNHSCDPNCETAEYDDQIWIQAMRDIEPGEELVYDYYLYDGEEEAPCYCGAKTCRGTMYGVSPSSQKKK